MSAQSESSAPSPSRPRLPLSESTLRAFGGGDGRKSTRHRLSSAASNSTLRSRLESETDYGGDDVLFHQPRPRHFSANVVQPWLFGQIPDEPPPRAISPAPLRVSSPLRPYASHLSFSSLDPSSSTTSSAMVNPISVAPRGAFSSRPSTLRSSRTDSMARRAVRWMNKVGLKDWIIPLSVAIAVWTRWVVGLGGYSGRGAPPMFGDYEAQRHWMEITLHLPVREWYFYDLPYWGLDYPPLTAYVSWICGYVGNAFNTGWFALESSRGIETPGSKTYLRATVLALDLVFYIPAVVFFSLRWWRSRSHRTQAISVLTLLFQPGLILIDNGHFQYNSVMLGLLLWAVNFLNAGEDVLGAVAFVLSLGFKQMALYYSPAIFAYLLGKCLYLGGSRGRSLFFALAIASILTVFLLFAPFFQPPFPKIFLQPILRMFPFGRGLFEDKVANFWCGSNVFIKWKEQTWAQGRLPLMALGLTILGILPSTIHILVLSWYAGNNTSDEISNGKLHAGRSPWRSSKPSPAIALLPYALFNCSLAFFLFSFQVHEKSILLPLLPLTLLISARQDLGISETGVWEWGVLFNNVAVFSMWPLLKKDGQAIGYATLTLFWNVLIGYNPLTIPKSLIKSISLAVYGATGALHVFELLLNPPSRYPDLFAVLNVLLCGPIFGLCWLWGMKRQLEAGWALTSLGGSRSTDSSGIRTMGQLNRAGEEEGKSAVSAGGSSGPSLLRRRPQ